MEANGPAAEDDDRVEVGEAGQGLEHTRAPDEPADADAPKAAAEARHPHHVRPRRLRSYNFFKLLILFKPYLPWKDSRH